MASDRTAKFSVNIPVETNAEEAADSLEHLRARIEGGESAIKNMRAAFGRLRGSSDEVKAAKAQLTAKLNAERDAISAANLKMLKAGTTYDSVAVKAKKLAHEQDALKKDKLSAMSAAVSKAGGPVSDLRDRMRSLGEVVGGAGTAMGLATLAAVGLVAALAAVSVAVVAGGVALGKWIIGVANTERTMNLMREAAAGSAKNASALGTQVDALAEKVPTARAALNELAIALMKSKLGGQATVDAFNAIGQASAALGDEAGGKIKDFIERGRLMGRMRINPLEMREGFGDLNFDDVAKSLATSMRVSVAQARLALFEGRVKLGDGAKALRDAVESKFGDINLRRMRDLDVLATKFKEKLSALTKDVSIEPLLAGLSKLVSFFDESTDAGNALKTAITLFGNVMMKAFTIAMPFVETFMNGMILGGLDLVIVLLKVHNYLKKTFADSTTLQGIAGLVDPLEAGKIAIQGIGAALVLVAGFAAAAAAPFVLFGMGLYAVSRAGEALGQAMKAAYQYFAELDWKAAGTAIVEGLIEGLKSGARRLTESITGLANSVKKGFTDTLQIHSPSKVTGGYGRETVAGYVDEVKAGTPEAAKAVDGLVQGPSKGTGGGRGGAGGGVTVNLGGVHIAAGGGDVEQIAKAMADPSILAPLIKAIEDAILGATAREAT